MSRPVGSWKASKADTFSGQDRALGHYNPISSPPEILELNRRTKLKDTNNKVSFCRMNNKHMTHVRTPDKINLSVRKHFSTLFDFREGYKIMKK